MKTYLIHEPFNIYQFTTLEWAHPEHKHTYFEIIFILKGSGVHTLNGKALRYRKGDIFFLGPEDYHSFRIEHQTEFCYIRFTGPSNQAQEGGQKTFPFGMSNTVTGVRIAAPDDKANLHALLTVLRSEYEWRFRPGFDAIRDGIMSAMISILNRNMQHHASAESSGRQVDVGDLVTYVRTNIAVPDKLTIPHLASRFNFSSSYVSNYFKRRTGESLKTFIIKTRLKLVETRLLYSNATLAEIAYELGYTDESHLCKQFRKYTGFTPAHFRKRA
jgi:AraC family transcriptional regulator, L-rhamnose operon regulatory protein RhaS